MKKFLRIGAIITSFILIFTSLTLIINANEAESLALDESYTDYTPKEAIAEGYFLYYTAATGKAEKLSNSTFSSKLMNYQNRMTQCFRPCNFLPRSKGYTASRLV